jgi:5'/3'-nucleotidase
MRALVTNDDGVHSPGLAVLAGAARRCGLDVTVVAPFFDASGSSAAMTAVAEEGQVTVTEESDAFGAAAMGVHGPPAFIVRAAMFGAFGPPPDLVLSGVNRGLNTGRAILHSGTVGAALTAANYGRRAVAVSADVVEEGGWDIWEDIVGTAIGWLTRTPPATVLNVNLPAEPAAGPAAQGSRPDGWRRRVRATTLAEAGTFQGQVNDSGSSVPVVFDDTGGPVDPATDVAALIEGLVSVTAIRSVVEDARFDLDRLLG